MARPSKLTPAVHAAIVGHVKNGIPRPAAFAAAGVSPSTGSEWIRRGEGRDDRPEDEAFAVFATDIGVAEGEYQTRLLGVVHAAADAGDARHARWLLERRFPQHWGPHQVIQTEGESEPPLTLLRMAEMLGVWRNAREPCRVAGCASRAVIPHAYN